MKKPASGISCRWCCTAPASTPWNFPTAMPCAARSPNARPRSSSTILARFRRRHRLGGRARQERFHRRGAADEHARRGRARSRQEHRHPAQAQHAAGAQEAVRDRSDRQSAAGSQARPAAERGLAHRADEALNNNWIEFWYQPKIDMRKRRLAGAEAYARARHPQHGIVLPASFMPNAKEDAVARLSELALNSALKAGFRSRTSASICGSR